MKVAVIVQLDNRTVTETVELEGAERQMWRAAIGDIACRIELSTYGPPGPVEEMTREDQPVTFSGKFKRS